MAEKAERDYMRGYLVNTRMFSQMTQIAMRIATKTHTAFIVHAEFGEGGGL